MDARTKPEDWPVAARGETTARSRGSLSDAAVRSTSPTALRPLVTTAAEDLLRGLVNRELWAGLGWRDVRLRYRRTVIGPFWTSFSLAFYVLAVGAVGAGLWNQPLREYLPFLVSGMVAWQLISSIVVEGGAMFLFSATLLREVNFNYSILAYALVWRNFIVFLHNLVVYAPITLLLAPQDFSPAFLLIAPGIVIVLANGVWVAILFGMLCLRFRDVQQLIVNVMQIALFVTPVFWPPESLNGARHFVFVKLNPLFHMIEILRAPLLGKVPPLSTYAAVALMTAAGGAAAFLVFRRYRSQIAYWS